MGGSDVDPIRAWTVAQNIDHRWKEDYLNRDDPYMGSFDLLSCILDNAKVPIDWDTSEMPPINRNPVLAIIDLCTRSTRPVKCYPMNDIYVDAPTKLSTSYRDVSYVLYPYPIEDEEIDIEEIIEASVEPDDEYWKSTLELLSKIDLGQVEEEPDIEDVIPIRNEVNYDPDETARVFQEQGLFAALGISFSDEEETDNNVSQLADEEYIENPNKELYELLGLTETSDHEGSIEDNFDYDSNFMFTSGGHNSGSGEEFSDDDEEDSNESPDYGAWDL